MSIWTENITAKFHEKNSKPLLKNLQNTVGDYFFLPHPVDKADSLSHITWHQSVNQSITSVHDSCTSYQLLCTLKSDNSTTATSAEEEMFLQQAFSSSCKQTRILIPRSSICSLGFSQLNSSPPPGMTTQQQQQQYSWVSSSPLVQQLWFCERRPDVSCVPSPVTCLDWPHR